jgi:hypothetical protein
MQNAILCKKLGVHNNAAEFSLINCKRVNAHSTVGIDLTLYIQREISFDIVHVDA